jgi:hypothetical protein
MEDAAKALRLIKKRVGQNACAACRADDWAVIKGGQPITFLSFEAKDDPRVRVLGFACRNCGYLRFHALEVLEDDSVDAARER